MLTIKPDRQLRFAYFQQTLLRKAKQHSNDYRWQLYRKRSITHRLAYVLHDQASFFNEAEKEQAPKAEEPTPDTILIPQHERKKKRSQAEMMKGLPVEEVLLELPEDQRICGICGGLAAALRPLKKYFFGNVKKRLDIWGHPCYYDVTQELQGEAASPYERK